MTVVNLLSAGIWNCIVTVYSKTEVSYFDYHKNVLDNTHLRVQKEHDHVNEIDQIEVSDWASSDDDDDYFIY